MEQAKSCAMMHANYLPCTHKSPSCFRLSLLQMNARAQHFSFRTLNSKADPDF